MSPEPANPHKNVYTGRVLWLLQSDLKFWVEFAGIHKTVVIISSNKCIPIL